MDADPAVVKSSHARYAAAAGSGILVWMVIAAASGRQEAWDSPLYFSLGMPVLCVVAAALGFTEPQRTWRWGVIPVCAQAIWMVATSKGASFALLPLTVPMVGILSILPILSARLGALAAARFEPS